MQKLYNGLSIASCRCSHCLSGPGGQAIRSIGERIAHGVRTRSWKTQTLLYSGATVAAWEAQFKGQRRRDWDAAIKHMNEEVSAGADRIVAKCDEMDRLLRASQIEDNERTRMDTEREIRNMSRYRRKKHRSALDLRDAVPGNTGSRIDEVQQKPVMDRDVSESSDLENQQVYIPPKVQKEQDGSFHHDLRSSDRTAMSADISRLERLIDHNATSQSTNMQTDDISLSEVVPEVVPNPLHKRAASPTKFHYEKAYDEGEWINPNLVHTDKDLLDTIVDYVRRPLNRGHLYFIHSLSPESIYNPNRSENFDAESVLKWTPKKREVNRLMMLMIKLQILFEIKRVGISTEMFASLSYSMRLSLQSQLTRLNDRWCDAADALQKVVNSEFSLPDYVPPESTRRSTNGIPEWAYSINDVNRHLMNVFREHRNNHFTLLLVDLFRILDLTRVPATLTTFKILIAGLADRRAVKFVSRLLFTLHEAHIRLDENIVSIILQYTVMCNQKQAFDTWLGYTQSENGGLGLANSSILAKGHDLKQFMKIKEENDGKVIQGMRPNPEIMAAMIGGKLFFSGFEETVAFCIQMEEEGYGLCLRSIAMLVRNCAGRADIENGLAFWKIALTLLEEPRIEEDDTDTRMPRELYRAMLWLCDSVNDSELFHKVKVMAVKDWTGRFLETSSVAKLLERHPEVPDEEIIEDGSEQSVLERKAIAYKPLWEKKLKAEAPHYFYGSQLDTIGVSEPIRSFLRRKYDVPYEKTIEHVLNVDETIKNTIEAQAAVEDTITDQSQSEVKTGDNGAATVQETCDLEAENTSDLAEDVQQMSEQSIRQHADTQHKQSTMKTNKSNEPVLRSRVIVDRSQSSKTPRPFNGQIHTMGDNMERSSYNVQSRHSYSTFSAGKTRRAIHGGQTASHWQYESSDSGLRTNSIDEHLVKLSSHYVLVPG